MDRTKLDSLVNVNFVTFVNKSGEWPHFLWNVKIGEENFDYKTGIGHFTNKYMSNYSWGLNKKPENSVFVSGIPNDKRRVTADPKTLEGWAHIPKSIDIVNSLLSDSELGNQSFVNFCGALDYDTDSIKAFNVYRECQDIGLKVQRAFGKELNNVTKLIEDERELGNI